MRRKAPSQKPATETTSDAEFFDGSPALSPAAIPPPGRVCRPIGARLTTGLVGLQTKLGLTDATLHETADAALKRISDLENELSHPPAQRATLIQSRSKGAEL